MQLIDFYFLQELQTNGLNEEKVYKQEIETQSWRSRLY